MKKKTLLLFTALTLVSSVLVGCKGNQPVDDSKTITIKVYKGGYGTTWLYQLKENFEAVYAAEGYKVNIKAPDSTLKANEALADMRTAYSKNHVDIYFVQDVFTSDVTNADYGVCAETLDDVYNSSAISFDGVEENGLIKDKLKDSYDDSLMRDGHYYSTLWASSPCGLVVNKKVMNKYQLSMPKTTDELKNCYDVISSHSATDQIYPISYSLKNSPGYALFCLYPNLAQALGKEDYYRFMALQADPTAKEPSQNDINNGYDAYNNSAIYEPIDLLRTFYDKAKAYPGVTSREISLVHGDVALGEAAFTFDGEFFFNEIKTEYKDYLDDVTFINTPVNSKLGEYLSISEAKLSEIVGLVDEGKTISEIAALAQVNEPTATRVYEARTAFYEKVNHNAYIRSGSDKVEIAKLFLRMACSDDLGKTFNDTASAYFPYLKENKTTSKYEFIQNVFKMADRKDSWGINNHNETGLRNKALIKVYEPYNDDLIVELVDKQSSEMTDRIKNYMTNKTNWDRFMRNAGYDPD